MGLCGSGVLRADKGGQGPESHQRESGRGTDKVQALSVCGASVRCSGPCVKPAMFLGDSGSGPSLTSQQPHDLGPVTSAPVPQFFIWKMGVRLRLAGQSWRQRAIVAGAGELVEAGKAALGQGDPGFPLGNRKCLLPRSPPWPQETS